MTDDLKFELAVSPEKIISQADCNEIASFLLGHINDLTNKEWEQRLIAGQHKVKLLNEPNKTNAQAKAEFEISQQYQDWQLTVMELRKYRQFRGDVKDRFIVLANLKRY